MSEDKKPLNIMMLGRAGSGKGTQTKMICEKFGVEYIGSGALLREYAGQDNDVAKNLREVMAAGHLVPTWMVSFLWLRKVLSLPADKGLVFDGSPRKIAEAHMIDEVLAWCGRDKVKVILIELSREEGLRRVLERRICTKCGQESADPKNTGVCEKCGGKLELRLEDQNKEAMEKRMDWFDDEVGEVIKHYDEKGMTIRINGDQTPEKVFEDISKALES